MPTVSEKQRRAMWAAKEGRSTLGIPRRVGEEFVGDSAGGIAAGVLHVAPDGDVLLLRRSSTEENYAGHWALPGGKADGQEGPEEAASREVAEELGNTSPQGPMRLMDRRRTPSGMTFHTFAKPVGEKFWPRINSEHSAAGWFPLDQLPIPLHPAVKDTLGGQDGLGMAEDLDEDDWRALRDNFAAWARGAEGEEQAQDGELIVDVDDDEGQLERLLLYIMENSEVGHSFDVVVDPDDRELAKKFYIDGDGAFRIRGIKTTGPEHAKDSICAACSGSGKVAGGTCEPCGGSGVATLINAPMKPGMDAEFQESDHPRAPDGKFGSGSGQSSSPEADNKPRIVSSKKMQKAVLKNEWARNGRDLDFEDVWQTDEGNKLWEREADAWNAEHDADLDYDEIYDDEGFRDAFAKKHLDGKKAPFPGVDEANDYFEFHGQTKSAAYLPGAMDAMLLAFDRAPPGLVVDRYGLAFDRSAESVRSESPDGHLHVEVSNISKAAVNPYRGDEIPNWRELGLAADKVYQLLRDPEELRKAAPTFNNKPLLDEHVPVNAKDHKPEHVIGSTGTDADFDGEYLKNSLVVWADKGISAIKSKKKKELSSAYRYRADMTPGTHPKLGRYDGVMRDIVGNHVALVEDGRAGPDVVVGDSRNPLIPKEEKFDMSKKVLLSRMGTVAYGALMTHLQPKLAMDAKLDLTRGLRSINAKNFRAKRPVLAAWLVESLKGKLDPKFAQDGSIKAGLDAVLDMIEGMPKAEDEFPDAEKDEDKAEDEDKNEEEEDDEKEPAEDEDLDAEEKRRLEFSKDKKAKDKKPTAGARDKKARDEKPDDEEKEKKAMDAAMDAKVTAAVKAERELQQQIYAAKDHVRGRVGELASMAFDSVEGVYLHAIKAAGKDPKPLEGSKPEALKFFFDNLPAPASQGGGHRSTFALDSAAGAGASGIASVSQTLAKNLQRIKSA
jgi:uncharacterized protein